MKMTKSLQSEDKIIIGKLGKVRGLDGSLKIIPLTDFEDRFDDLEKIFVGEKIMQVEKVYHTGDEIFIKFQGVDNREFAKTLTNKFLKVDKKDAAPLEDGEFYTFDIIGCETGSNDVFQVKGESEILIPALKSVIKKIDIAEKKIFIDSTQLEEI